MARGVRGLAAMERAHFRRLLDEGLAKAREERRLAGLQAPIGLERILLEDPQRSIGDCFPAFARNPRIACKDRGTRIDVRGAQVLEHAPLRVEPHRAVRAREARRVHVEVRLLRAPDRDAGGLGAELEAARAGPGRERDGAPLH